MRGEDLRDVSPAGEPAKVFVVLSGALGALLALFFSLMLLFNFTDSGAYLPLLCFFCAATGGVGWALFTARWEAWANLPALARRALAAVAILGLFLCQLRFAKALYGNIDYDFNYVYTAAKALAFEGTLGGVEEYFAQFPNNVTLVLLFAAVLKVCGAVGYSNGMAALTFCDLLAVDAALLFLFLCARKLVGRRGAVFALSLALSLVGFHYGVVCPYSDIYSMLAVMAFLYLYLCPPKRGAAGAWAAVGMGAVAAVGGKIKPQALIPAIAVGMVELAYRRWDRERLLYLGKRLACFTVGALVALLAVEGLTRGLTGGVLTPELRAEKEVPFTHYLMMGLNPDTRGFFSSEDWAATHAIPGGAAKSAYHWRVIGQRLGDLGPLGLLGFLLEKARLIFHHVRVDMWVRAPFPSQDPLSVAIQQAFCQGGAGFDVYQRLLQGLWVWLLALWVLPVVFCPDSFRDKAGTALRLSVMGLALFELLFEGGPRYLFHQYPVFILLAVWGLWRLPEGVRRRWAALAAWARRRKGADRAG